MRKTILFKHKAIAGMALCIGLTSASLSAIASNATASDAETNKAMHSSQTSSPKSAEHAKKLDQFVQKMVKKHQFEADYIQGFLKDAQPNQQILDAISRPWEAKPWHQYYPIFLTEKRITKGVKFWEEHKGTLQKAEKELGIPAEIIVAIIGVETYYGGYKGKYSVLDALYTLGFHYPPRAKFFSKELEEFFVLTRDEKLNLTELKGSYAGAMGWGQFISSSYRNYAIDFDGDGVRDLLNNPVDAIGSVANYFKRHGWKTGEDVAYPAQVNGDDLSSLVSKDLKYKHSWQDIENKGVRLFTQHKHKVKADTNAKLLEFEQKDSKEYWVGLHNFYVITRYNHSPLYAMAVYQLSQEIKSRKLQS